MMLKAPARSNVVAMPKPQVDPIYLALAAGDMAEQGRLFEADEEAAESAAHEATELKEDD